MNIQDIADFIDLVKNPAKYEQVLRNLAEEKERLNAVVETVGKASELDKLRKAVEAKAATLESELATKTSEQDKSYQIRVKKAENLQARLEVALERAAKATQEAEEKMVVAQTLAASFATRDKAITKVEAELAAKQTELTTLVAEYNEKIAKLKSVMV